MLSREFTKKEIALLLFLVALLMGLLYYQFVYTDIRTRELSLDTASLEDEIMLEEAKAARIEAMQAEILTNQGGQATGVVETYNNLKREIAMLNDIFSEAETFQLAFDQAVADGDAVRRGIRCSFTARDYTSAKKMIEALHDSKYRCLIRELTITSRNDLVYKDGARGVLDLDEGPVAVDLKVTFFETLYGASTTDGLLFEKKKGAAPQESLTDQLAASREATESIGLQ
ncbi:hypothetical protein [Lachnoclostridium sp. Marseille-P6806]|uniref:hypothetical protein n=1 Tax=Lachnoclostridium sp. Marseille-P6806 TaxID=2364793 RepID=UPI001030368A|nr:hypothetical protein [Lachnoclostridium sp. Marseille-P6806]